MPPSALSSTHQSIVAECPPTLPALTAVKSSFISWPATMLGSAIVTIRDVRPSICPSVCVAREYLRNEARERAMVLLNANERKPVFQIQNFPSDLRPQVWFRQFVRFPTSGIHSDAWCAASVLNYQMYSSRTAASWWPASMWGVQKCLASLRPNSHSKRSQTRRASRRFGLVLGTTLGKFTPV